MAEARLEGMTFRLDPESIRWTFSVKTKVNHTVGGKVVQVYGTTIGDLIVSGSFGTGGEEAQARFMEQVLDYAKTQARNMQPIQFSFPPRNWNFTVFIKSLTTPDGPRSMVVAPEVFNPKYVLTLKVVNDNGDLKRVATDFYIERLAKGIGWTINEYNGFMDYGEMQREMSEHEAEVEGDGARPPTPGQGEGFGILAPGVNVDSDGNMIPPGTTSGGG